MTKKSNKDEKDVKEELWIPREYLKLTYNLKFIAFSIRKFIPTNLHEEKKVFYDHHHNYNPKFHYEDPKYLKEYLAQFEPPSLHNELFTACKNVILKIKEKYGNLQKYKEYLRKKLKNPEQGEFEKIYTQYLDMNDIDPDLIELNIDEDLMSNAFCSKHTINVNPRRCFNFHNTLNHEVGTHWTRKMNNRVQLFYKKKKKYKLKSNVQVSEEGLASLNTHLLQAEQNLDSYLYNACFCYYVCGIASIMDFKSCYQHILPYVGDHAETWDMLMRVKRGIQDTSVPGGMYKDQIYLVGAFSIMKNVNQLNFKVMHSCKIGLNDYYKVNKTCNTDSDEIIVPYFLRNYNHYIKLLKKIGKDNFFI